MNLYDLAALATFASCVLCIPRAIRWADKPQGRWSSATYGDQTDQS